MATISFRSKPGCTACKLHRDAEVVGEMGHGTVGEIMVVGRMPEIHGHDTLFKDLADVGIDAADCFFTSALKCQNYDANVGKTDIKMCRGYLEAEIRKVKPKWILALGNEALGALTNHSGIMKYRGRVIEHSSGAKIFPTISPNAVLRNPGQRSSYMADLKLFVAEMLGKDQTIPYPKVKFIKDKRSLQWLADKLDHAELLSYDVETFSTPHGNEWAPDARIISLSGTMVVAGELVVWACPSHTRNRLSANPGGAPCASWPHTSSACRSKSRRMASTTASGCGTSGSG